MIDENNTEANEGIRLVSDKYISLAYGAMQSNNLAKADKYIEKAKRIYSESDIVAPARSTLQEINHCPGHGNLLATDKHKQYKTKTEPNPD